MGTAWPRENRASFLDLIIREQDEPQDSPVMWPINFTLSATGLTCLLLQLKSH
jgi:hypothetical protein